MRSKLIRHRGGIVGVAGLMSDSWRILRHLENRGDIGAFPEADDHVQVLYLDEHGVVHIGSGKKPVLVPINAPFYAIGSGSHFALGAMWQGASAAEAVQAAIVFDTGSGGEVDVIELQKSQVPAPSPYMLGPTPLPQQEAVHAPIPTVAAASFGGPR